MILEGTAHTPTFDSENVISAIGPYAGSESRNDRWITERVRKGCAPEAVPFVAVLVASFDSPYKSFGRS